MVDDPLGFDAPLGYSPGFDPLGTAGTPLVFAPGQSEHPFAPMVNGSPITAANPSSGPLIAPAPTLTNTPGDINPRLPRGLRNNNPGNIEDGAFARSLPGYAGSDGRFAKFETTQHGLGAIDHLLSNYGSNHGVNTISGIVNRWAPASDNNNVSAYANFVANKVGVKPGDKIDLNDPGVRQKLAMAMGEFENGRPVGSGSGMNIAKMTGGGSGNSGDASGSNSASSTGSGLLGTNQAALKQLLLMQLLAPNHQLQKVDYDPFKVMPKVG